MAEAKSVSVVPLNGSNYATWKLQCQMALMKGDLWGIVNETETTPSRDAPAGHGYKILNRERLSTSCNCAWYRSIVVIPDR